MAVNSSALQAVEWCNPSTSCYGFCCSIAIIAGGDGRPMVQWCVCVYVCVCLCVCMCVCMCACLRLQSNSRLRDRASLSANDIQCITLCRNQDDMPEPMRDSLSSRIDELLEVRLKTTGASLSCFALFGQI